MLVALVFTHTAVAMADPAPSAGSEVPAKVPARLAQWELSVAGVPSGPASIRPIRIFSNGRYECDQVVQDSAGLRVKVHQGTVNERDRSILFTAARETFNRMTFSKPIVGKGTADAPDCEVRLSSGSRAMRAVLDEEAPAQMGFDAPLAQGLLAVNRISRIHRPARSDFGEPVRSSAKLQSQVPHGRDATVPAEAADWSSVYTRVILPDRDVKLTVYNPNDNPDDRYRRGYERSRNEMEIEIGKGGDKVPPVRRSVAVSKVDRDAFFEDVRVIVNQFELHDPRHDEAKGDVRCLVGIDGWLRRLEVEFKVNDALPGEWRTRVSRMVELGHRNDDAFPTLPDLRDVRDGN
ncbi:MAG: hypothetical protein ACM3U2_08220 [Deltaproteobacteria bacterium]